MPRHILGDDEDAAVLMAEAEAELREQAEEESANVFVSIKDLREFARALDPDQVVFVTAIMCVLASERLPNNRGSRVTVVDGFMQPHLKPYSRKLEKMDAYRRDTRVLKVTVWDPKVRSAPRPRFQIGSIYDLRKVDGLKFYHDLLQGNLQAGGATEPTLTREFGDFEAAKNARINPAPTPLEHTNIDFGEKEKEDMEP